MAWLANLSIWVALLAAALTLIAVAIDIALLVQVRLNGFGAGITTQPAPGSSTSYTSPRLLLLRPFETYFVYLFNRFLVGHINLSRVSSHR